MINVIAQFKTILATGISKTATSGVLDSNSSSDNDGATIPNGDYGIVIDERNSSREYAIITVDGFNFTFVKRGLSVIDGITEKESNKFDHRKGAEVKIVSHPIITLMTKTFNGEEPFGGVPMLPTDRELNLARQVVDKEYVDAISSAGILAMLVTEGTGLTININAGTYLLNGVVKEFSAASGVAITDDATNYIQVKDGAVEIMTDAFDDDVIPLAVVVAASGAITSVVDKRPFYTGVDIKADNGLGRDANGIFVDLGTDPGLEFSEDGLEVKVKSDGGIIKDEHGLSVDTTVHPVTPTMPAYEALVAGDLLKPYNDNGTSKLAKLAGIHQLSCAAVTPGKFVMINATSLLLTWESGSTIYGKVGVISGSSITFGSSVQLNAANSQTGTYSIAKASDNSYVLSYVYTDTKIVYAQCGTIAGNVVTPNANLMTLIPAADTTSSSGIQMSTLSNGNVAHKVVQNVGSFRVTLTILSVVSGSLSVISTNYTTASNYSTFAHLVALSDTQFLLAWNESSGYDLIGIGCVLSGATLTFSSTMTLIDGAAGDMVSEIYSTKYAENSALLLTKRTVTTTPVLMEVSLGALNLPVVSRTTSLASITVSPLIVTEGRIYVVGASGVYKLVMGSSSFVVVKTDTSLATSYQDWILDHYNGRLISFVSTTLANYFLLDHDEFITSADAAYDVDDEVPLLSFFTSFTGLTPGIDYYVNTAGSGVSAINTYQKVGKAISSTKIIKQ